MFLLVENISRQPFRRRPLRSSFMAARFQSQIRTRADHARWERTARAPGVRRGSRRREDEPPGTSGDWGSQQARSTILLRGVRRVALCACPSLYDLSNPGVLGAPAVLSPSRVIPVTHARFLPLGATQPTGLGESRDRPREAAADGLLRLQVELDARHPFVAPGEVSVARQIAHDAHDIVACLVVGYALYERVELHSRRTREPSFDRVGAAVVRGDSEGNVTVKAVEQLAQEGWANADGKWGAGQVGVIVIHRELVRDRARGLREQLHQADGARGRDNIRIEAALLAHHRPDQAGGYRLGRLCRVDLPWVR